MRWLGGKSDLDGQESRLRKHATARRRPGTVRSTDLPTGSLALAQERRRPPSPRRGRNPRHGGRKAASTGSLSWSKRRSWRLGRGVGRSVASRLLPASLRSLERKPSAVSRNCRQLAAGNCGRRRQRSPRTRGACLIDQPRHLCAPARGELRVSRRQSRLRTVSRRGVAGAGFEHHSGPPVAAASEVDPVSPSSRNSPERDRMATIGLERLSARLPHFLVDVVRDGSDLAKASRSGASASGREPVPAAPGPSPTSRRPIRPPAREVLSPSRSSARRSRSSPRCGSSRWGRSGRCFSRRPRSMP